MEKVFNGLESLMMEQWNAFQNNLPAITLALLVVIVGVFIIQQLRKVAQRIIARRSRDPLATEFLVSIIALILTVFVVTIAMSILGWSSFTNKILAAAGLTTFIVGFALKDIGENFLAGILMAFRRPFRMGDLIEVNGIRGRVFRMSLRETTVKTLQGVDVYIPNGIILKNPLQNFTIDNFMRADFTIGLDYTEQFENALQIIESEVKSFEEIQKYPEPQILVQELAGNTINVEVRFWFRTNDVSAPGASLRSRVMLQVYENLIANGFGVAGDSLDVKLVNLKKAGLNIK